MFTPGRGGSRGRGGEGARVETRTFSSLMRERDPGRSSSLVRAG